MSYCKAYLSFKTIDMNFQKLVECEAKRMRKIHLLPNYFKKIGVALAILSIFIMLLPKILGMETGIIGSLGKNFFLVAMLLFTISKDQIEDELSMQLRAQSYSWAFVFGVAYAIIQPYITYSMELLLKPDKAVLVDLDVFSILWFMLMLQILFFYVFKKAR